MAEKQLQTKETTSTLCAYSTFQPDKIIHRSDCKVCISEYREEVEREFSSSESYKAAYNKMKMKDTSVSYDAVYRHIRNHFTPYMRGIMIKDYAANIDRMMKIKYNRKDEIEERIRMMQNRMYEIEAVVAGGDLASMLKSADALNKLNSAIARLDEQLAEMEREMEPIYMMLQNLKEVMHDKMKEANNPAVTKALTDVFAKLVALVKENEIMIEKK